MRFRVPRPDGQSERSSALARPRNQSANLCSCVPRGRSGCDFASSRPDGQSGHKLALVPQAGILSTNPRSRAQTGHSR
eukprot:7117499-Pyramimonas_sp.AAC.1